MNRNRNHAQRPDRMTRTPTRFDRATMPPRWSLRVTTLARIGGALLLGAFLAGQYMTP